MNLPPLRGRFLAKYSAISVEGVIGYPAKKLAPATKAPSAQASFPWRILALQLWQNPGILIRIDGTGCIYPVSKQEARLCLPLKLRLGKRQYRYCTFYTRLQKYGLFQSPLLALFLLLSQPQSSLSLQPSFSFPPY